jgi:hypothetical protein
MVVSLSVDSWLFLMISLARSVPRVRLRHPRMDSKYCVLQPLVSSRVAGFGVDAGVVVGVAVGLGEAVAVGLGEAVAVGLGEAVAVGSDDAVAVGSDDAVAVGSDDAVAVGSVGATVEVTVDSVALETTEDGDPPPQAARNPATRIRTRT